MKRTDAAELLRKYADGTCSEEELAVLHTWYLTQNETKSEISVAEVESAKQKIWSGLPVHDINSPETFKLLPTTLIKRIAVAAIFILSLSLSYYFIKKDRFENTQLAKQDQIVPGGNKAILTLADGSKLDLNQITAGVLSQEHGTKITKTKDGHILYTSTESDVRTIAWNLLSTPAGGYYKITLSDGTIVWLNSKSSLKYPNEFTAKERVVELNGEGYFEVAHKKNQPFKVVTEHQTVEVLGTHFNINAYNDEQTTTTLLEGSVRIGAYGLQKILAPNQQAKLANGNITVSAYNADLAIDWVNNDFIFESENLGSIMRKIARWYDVEVSYPTNLSNLEFTGSISRNKNISQVLKIMQLTGIVNFKVEGRRITVTP